MRSFFAQSLCYTPQIADMNLKELKEIIDIVTSKESIEELEIEKSGVRLRIRRASNHAVAVSSHAAAAAAMAPAVTPSLPPAQTVQETPEELFYVKSPI